MRTKTYPGKSHIGTKAVHEIQLEKPAHTHYYLKFAEEKGEVELREFFAIGLRSGIGIGAEVVQAVEGDKVEKPKEDKS